MKHTNFITRGILAGICIGLAGFIYLKTGGVVGAILFAFGLIAVVSMKLNLFTGKAQFVWSFNTQNLYSQGGYAWLFFILVLNIIGCMAVGAILPDVDIREAAMNIIEKRLESSPVRNGVLAIGCGFIMTLAVQNASKNKWLPLLFGIPAFIICGLPHCIADAFYIASLPGDYFIEKIGDISIFYVAIVSGNFIGCNIYRFVGENELQTGSSLSPEGRRHQHDQSENLETSGQHQK